MFVTKDDSYLETYFHQHSEESYSNSSGSEIDSSEASQEEVNLEWV